MVTLVAGQPHRSREPVLRVDNRFRPGTLLRFTLVVHDAAGTASRPDQISVQVLPATPLAPARREHP